MSTQINDFYDLDAWKKSHALVLHIYRVSKNMPVSELYGVISQIRRAASSVTANLAEGFARYHYKDKTRFYYQARGSIAEVQNFIFLCADLGYISEHETTVLHEEACVARKIINGLIRSIVRENL